MIDSLIALALIWVLLYFYTRSMYREVIIPDSWTEKRRELFAELAGVFCIVTAPIGLLYITEEFCFLTLKMLWYGVGIGLGNRKKRIKENGNE